MTTAENLLLLREIRDLLVEIRDDKRASDKKADDVVDAMRSVFDSYVTIESPSHNAMPETPQKNEMHNCGDDTRVEDLGDNLYRITMHCACGASAVGIATIETAVLSDGVPALPLQEGVGGAIVFKEDAKHVLVLPNGGDEPLIEGSATWLAIMCGTMLETDEIRDRVADLVRDHYRVRGAQ